MNIRTAATASEGRRPTHSCINR